MSGEHIGRLELHHIWRVMPSDRPYPDEDADEHVTGVAAATAHLVGPDGADAVPVVEVMPPSSTLSTDGRAARWDAETARAVGRQMVETADWLLRTDLGHRGTRPPPRPEPPAGAAGDGSRETP